MFLKNLQKPFLYIKEQLSQRNFKINVCFVFFFNFSKTGKTVFDLDKGKTNLF